MLLLNGIVDVEKIHDAGPHAQPQLGAQGVVAPCIDLKAFV
jgi:hypothetical protein